MDEKITRLSTSYTAQKLRFYIKDFFSKCDQIRSFRRIWSYLLKRSLMKNLIFCVVLPMKILTLQDIIKFIILKLIHFYYNNDQSLKLVESVFTNNESVNRYKTRCGKLFFITHVNKTHFSANLLRYIGPLTLNNFSRRINNFYNVGISKFNIFLEDLRRENYY